MTIQDFDKIDIISTRDGNPLLVIVDPGNLVDDDRLFALQKKAALYAAALEDPEFRQQHANWESARITVHHALEVTDAMKEFGPVKAMIDGQEITIPVEFELSESSFISSDDEKVRLIDPEYNMRTLTEDVVKWAKTEIEANEFTVFAVTQDQNGGGQLLNLGFVSGDARLDAAREAVKQSAAQDSTVAVAVAYDVMAQHPDQQEKSDAIAIEIEHRSGDAQQRVVHYTKQGDQVETMRPYGQLVPPKFFQPTPVESSESTDDAESEFSEEEKQDTLATSPSMCFLLVSAIDGDISKKEIIAFGKQLEKYSQHSNPLVQQIFSQAMPRFEHDVKELLSLGPSLALMIPMKLAMCRAWINESHPDQAEEFFDALLEMSTQVAAAEGGFLGFGNKISKEERAALDIITAALKGKKAEG